MTTEALYTGDKHRHLAERRLLHERAIEVINLVLTVGARGRVEIRDSDGELLAAHTLAIDVDERVTSAVCMAAKDAVLAASTSSGRLMMRSLQVIRGTTLLAGRRLPGTRRPPPGGVLKGLFAKNHCSMH